MSLNPLKRVNSILTYFKTDEIDEDLRLNPLKRVNSILTKVGIDEYLNKDEESQSPQTGQFNSYLYVIVINWKADCKRLNPLKRVNSILTPG